MLASELNILFFINISVDSCLQQNTTSKTVLSPKNYITSIHFLIHIFISIYTHTYKTPVLFPWSQEMVPCFFSSIYHSWNFNYCYLVVDITIITSPDLSFTFLGTHCYFPLYKIFSEHGIGVSYLMLGREDFSSFLKQKDIKYLKSIFKIIIVSNI